MSTRISQERRMRNCLTDEGRPLEVGLQERTSNHLRRLWLSAMVVSAEGKVRHRPGQVSGKKRTARKPPLKCRKQIRRCQNRGAMTTAGQSSDETCLRAERHPAREVA